MLACLTVICETTCEHTEQDFDAIMGTCDAARLPADQHFTAGEFWAGLLATAWVTGMRKSALLCLLWEDVDLDAGLAVSRHHDNKQKREQRHRIAAAAPFLHRRCTKRNHRQHLLAEYVSLPHSIRGSKFLACYTGLTGIILTDRARPCTLLLLWCRGGPRGMENEEFAIRYWNLSGRASVTA